MKGFQVSYTFQIDDLKDYRVGYLFLCGKKLWKFFPKTKRCLRFTLRIGTVKKTGWGTVTSLKYRPAPGSNNWVREAPYLQGKIGNMKINTWVDMSIENVFKTLCMCWKVKKLHFTIVEVVKKEKTKKCPT